MIEEVSDSCPEWARVSGQRKFMVISQAKSSAGTHFSEWPRAHAAAAGRLYLAT
jgi:hypothetical protein